MPRPRPTRRRPRPSRPAPRPEREAAKAETREALLRAGIEEIAARGLDVPSLDAICARAGYTRGAFYVHFRDREDFLVAVMERFLGQLYDAVIATGDERSDLEETVRRFAGLLLLPPEQAVPLHRVMDVSSRAPAFRARLGERLREAALRVAKAARQGQAAASVRRDADAEAIGEILVALAIGALAAHEAGLALDLPRARDTLVRLLRP
jgi:AcrR family transcriptional regulator